VVDSVDSEETVDSAETVDAVEMIAVAILVIAHAVAVNLAAANVKNIAAAVVE